MILACRNLIKGQSAKEKLLRETKCSEKQLKLMELDLSSLKSIRNFVQRFFDEENEIDVLICNAGLARSKIKLTEDHFDQIIQSNYLGHFLLTRLLFDQFQQTKAKRIVNVSSDLHQSSFFFLAFPFVFDKFQINSILVVKSIDDWSDVFTQLSNHSLMGSYPQSKLFQILSTIQMKRFYQSLFIAFCPASSKKKSKKIFSLIEEKEIDVFSLTPGWVSTNIEDPLEDSIPSFTLPIYHLFIFLMKFFFGRTAGKGAETILFCANDSSLNRSSQIFFQ